MAIIKEEEETMKQPPPVSNPSPPPPNPFTFWLYFTLVVSIIAFLFVSFSSQDPNSWFLTLPDHLRQHYSSGRIIKVQASSGNDPIQLFITQKGPSSTENVLIIPGLGLSSYDFSKVCNFLADRGVHVVALDLPGFGFSENFVIEEEGARRGLIAQLKDVYTLIREKGLFWAFDRMVETGEIPYEEIESILVSSRKRFRVGELGSEEVSRVLNQVFESIKLSNVHLVLHDSALGVCANWVLENSSGVRSVTLLDTDSRLVPALPYWTYALPFIRDIVLRISSVYAKVLNSCCTKEIGGLTLDAHRAFLKQNDRTEALLGIAKKLNHSFDLTEWGSSDALKSVPMLVVWSDSWSTEWSNEGSKVASDLPLARFITHSGGRWPQDNAADEVAGHILQFVSSLPKSVKLVEEEPQREHIHKMFDEAKVGDHGHDHHHGHAHIHEGDFTDAYGLDQGWES